MDDEDLILSEDGRTVGGVIDFGDTVYSSRVNDVAIAMAYAMVSSYGQRAPVTAAAAFLRGYNRVDPLPPPEPDPREAVLAKARRVRDRANKAGDRAEEAERAMLRAESLAAARRSGSVKHTPSP